jgi:allophanate hydrolase subunit 1
MDTSRPKHGGYQEESPAASERKAAVQLPVWSDTEVLHDLTTVLKESAARRETTYTIITEISYNKAFR